MSLSLEQATGGNFCLSKVVLAVGTTNTGLSTAATANYVLDGVFKTAVAATATFALAAATGFTITTPVTAGNKCCLGVWLDSSGNFKITQGPLTPYSVSTDKAAPPPTPASMALVGVATITAATATFTPGTSAFAVTGTSVTYTDCMTLQPTGFA